MTTTRRPSKQRERILTASYRANRAADALRYLNSAVGAASEVGVELDRATATMRVNLTIQLECDAKIAGFKASEFYSEE